MFTAEQEARFVKENLGPALADLGVRIFVYDHCKERLFERCLKFYSDPDLAKYVAGIACHWYSGDHFGEIELCRRTYPDKAVLMSEGCTSHPEKGFDEAGCWRQAEKYAHDIIGDLNAGLNYFVDWNITLDENNGLFHSRQGRNFCDAGIFCDARNDRLVYHPNYYFIGQFSKFIRPGAVRIGFSCYTDRLETTAFQNTDGSLATVVYNRDDEEHEYILRIHGQLLKRAAKPHSVETVVFSEDDLRRTAFPGEFRTEGRPPRPDAVCSRPECLVQVFVRTPAGKMNGVKTFTKGEKPNGSKKE